MQPETPIMQKGWFVIINPAAGARKSERAWEDTRNFLESIGEPFAFEITNQVMHACDIARAAVLQGYRKLFIVGGDGTLNEVVNGVFSQAEVPTADITIGIASVGTGNDFIKTLGIPKNAKKAIELLKTGRPRLLDAGLAFYQEGNERRQRYFINVAGMAFDAAVTKHANENKKGNGGAFQYLVSMVKTLSRYKSTHVRLQLDERVEEDTCFCLNVGNCRYAGGGMMIVPEAVPDDGLFHVTFVKDITKMEVIQNIGNLFKGTFLDNPKILTSTARHVKVESEPLIYLEVEGETLGHSPFEFQIIPAGIQVLVPV